MSNIQLQLSQQHEMQKSLAVYCESPCKPLDPTAAIKLNFQTEAHTTFWRNILAANSKTDWEKLQDAFPQMNIPIVTGISQTQAYTNVVKKGQPFAPDLFPGQFKLMQPHLFKCYIYDHPCGSLPILATSVREDFENLYFLLGCKCEPCQISSSVNAFLISGYTNWTRVNSYKQLWREQHRFPTFDIGWAEEMCKVAAQSPQNFKDSFLLLMKSPYSQVPLFDLNLSISEAEWLELSNIIRIEHEFTHYALKKTFGVMRSHLWDEVIADFMGITEALKDFDSKLFLRFFGLDQKSNIMPNARILHYINGLPGDLTDQLCKLMIPVSKGLEKFFNKRYKHTERMAMLLFLSQLSLLELSIFE